ncbi:MAG: O-methyltransferase [Bacteroidales bacterium]|nr:O-methyltransferase [Bacteroidales bacterium]
MDSYLASHTTAVDETLDSIERWTHLHTAQPQMLCGPYEGRLLTMLCRSAQAKCAVEIGTFVGYSTICIARGLSSGGKLHTFEVNEEYESLIRRNLASANLENCVELHIGDAGKLIPETIKESSSIIDFAFIDAGKRQNKQFYDLLVPRMRSGGIIVIDNTLWGRKVLDIKLHQDSDTRCVNEFNNYVNSDPRVENIMLDIRDGMLICNVL